MKNLFADFINQFTNHDWVLQELDEFIGNSEGMFTSKSGGSSTLGKIIHSSVQQAITKITIFQLTTKVGAELEFYQTNIQKDLAKKLQNDIEENGELNFNANFSTEDVANHFIAEVYTPLLKLSKEISTCVAPAGSFNNNNKFNNPIPT